MTICVKIKKIRKTLQASAQPFSRIVLESSIKETFKVKRKYSLQLCFLRYIACSYPAAGTVLAVASFEERIAFGGTTPVFNIVTFHDPKHEKYEGPPDDEYNYNKSVTLFHDDDATSIYSAFENTALPTQSNTKSTINC
ncbi:unnamed protein product [Diatraea saccharalis]|uniref:Uncharacterized protein n=1 Tax=Diatraea saccharalis TaxID=40085 RepID=A0A9N9QUH9_9NEOP|nr:unnamed protein product [Diatraea saccharalis]